MKWTYTYLWASSVETLTIFGSNPINFGESQNNFTCTLRDG